MAFENINWGMIPAAKRADQQMLMQAIGQGIGAYERGQDRQLKQRQLDMQAQKAPDIKQMAMNAVMKQQMGMPLDAQEQAAIGTMAATSSPRTYIDPITQQTVTQPSPWASLVGGQAPQMVTQQDMQLDNSPEAIANAMGVSVDDLRAAQGNVSTYQPAITDKVPTREEFETYKAGGVFEGTPKGAAMEEESRQKMAEQIAAEQIKQSFKNINLADFNDGQLTSANFGNRMNESAKIINSLSKDAEKGRTGFWGGISRALEVAPLGDFGSGLGEVAVQLNATPEQQQYLNAAENWITANLRKESGAVIGAEEKANEYRKYFPVAGDSGAVIEQKAKMREQAEKGMIGQSAGAYQKMFGKKGQAMQEKQTGAMSWEEYFK